MIAKIKSFLAAVWADTKDTWNRIKIYVLAILAVIVTLEFQKIKDALLAYGGKKEIQEDQKKDQTLAVQEKTDNDAADQLVKDAEALPSQEKPITNEDWYKNKDQQ